MDKKINTICIVLDAQLDKIEKDLHRENVCLKIRNVESFYNYRTIGEQMKLVTSGLSGGSDFCELIHSNLNSSFNNEYVVGDEKIIKQDEITFQNLYLKKCRLQYLMTNILENPLQIDDASVKKVSAPNEVETTMRTHANISSASKNDINTSRTSSSVQPILTTTQKFYNYFKKTVSTTKSKVKYSAPQFCRKEELTVKKPACNKCKVNCSYPIEMLLNNLNHLSQDEIREELKLHGHPKTRNIRKERGKNGKEKLIGATSREQAQELADHYIYAHSQIESHVP